MNDIEKWRERVRDTCAGGTSWWWWWWWRKLDGNYSLMTFIPWLFYLILHLYWFHLTFFLSFCLLFHFFLFLSFQISSIFFYPLPFRFVLSVRRIDRGMVSRIRRGVKTPAKIPECPRYDTQSWDGEVPEHHFIAIAPSFTLAWRVSTW